MGKTKTAFVGGVEEENLTGAEKYKERLKRKATIAQVSAVKEKSDKSSQKGEVGDRKVHISGLKGGQRIKTVENEVIQTEAETISEKEIKIKEKALKIRGKNYKSAKAKIDKNKYYPVGEAIKLLRDVSYSKFDGTIELHIIIKKVGLNTNINLPHPFGKAKIIEVANDKTIEKLKKNIVDFDVLIATPEMMPKLVPFARLLGPKGLMPNPKSGTLITNPKAQDDAFKTAQSLSIKTEKDHPIIHTAIAKLSFKDGDIIDNIDAVVNAINSKQIEKMYLKSSMSPSIKLSL